MVEVKEIVDEPDVEAQIPPSQERLLDAQEIEKAAATLTRPMAKMHLEGLAKKLRKESDALKRVEASNNSKGNTAGSTTKTPATSTANPATPKTTPATQAPQLSSSVTYVPVDKFAFDDGGYSGKFVTLYIDLPGVGDIEDRKNNITCQFTKTSFDLIVKDLRGKSYRLCKDNLANEIDVEKCKTVVKAEKVLIKLAKKKTEYGSFDHWTDLIAKGDSKKKAGSNGKDNPAAGIMDMMKDMYDSGDDKMRKVIGETMMKQQQGGGGMSGGMGGGGMVDMGLGDLDMDV